MEASGQLQELETRRQSPPGASGRASPAEGRLPTLGTVR